MKMCQRCLNEKEETFFTKDKSRKDGLYPYCKTCKSGLDKDYRSNEIIKEKMNQRSKKWRDENPEKYKDTLRKWKSKNINKKWSLDKKSHLWTHYRLSIEDYQKILNEQNNSCKICKKVTRLYVDHDHSCCSQKTTCGNCVRGLLCPSCNTLVGYLETKKDLVEEAYKYLEDN